MEEEVGCRSPNSRYRDLWSERPLMPQLQGPLGTESVTLSGTAPGWEPPDDPDTGSECSHPEVTPSPRFVAAKTQTNQSGKKAPASVVRCATLLHRTPPATQTQTFRTPNSGSPASKATAGTDGWHHPTLPPPLAFSPPAATMLSHCSPARASVESHHAPEQVWDPALPLASSVTVSQVLLPQTRG